MSKSKSLRDELAMSAPADNHITIGEAEILVGRPKPSERTMEAYDWWCEVSAKLRYRYADIALRVKAETMPKVDKKRTHPSWASWAVRDEDGEPKYFSHEPTRGGTMWFSNDPNCIVERVPGDTSFIPANWRESKVRL